MLQLERDSNRLYVKEPEGVIHRVKIIFQQAPESRSARHASRDAPRVAKDMSQEPVGPPVA